MPRPSVAVVVIGLNEEDRLEACFRSIRAAWREFDAESPITIVYVDSGSTDSSRSIALREADQVLVLASGPTAAAARQAGLVESDADWILFLDGDMELDPLWFKYCFGRDDLLNDQHVAGVIGMRTDHFERSSRKNENVYGVEQDRRAWHIGGALFARREWLSTVGGYRPEIWDGEEPELLSRLNHAGGRVIEVPVRFIDHFVDHQLTRSQKLHRWFISSRSPRHSFAKAALWALRGGYLVSFLRVHRYTTITWFGDVTTVFALIGGAWVPAVLVQVATGGGLLLKGKLSHWVVARLRAVGLIEQVFGRRRGEAIADLRYHRWVG